MSITTRSQTQKRQNPNNTQEIPTWGAKRSRHYRPSTLNNPLELPTWGTTRTFSNSGENTPPASPVRTASAVVPATVIATPPRHGTTSTAFGSPIPNPTGAFGSPVASNATRW